MGEALRCDVCETPYGDLECHNLQPFHIEAALRRQVKEQTERAETAEDLVALNIEAKEAAETKCEGLDQRLRIANSAMQAIIVRRNEAEAELSINAALLAKQTDLARQAEMERDEALDALAALDKAQP